jgi:hypothetical protein
MLDTTTDAPSAKSKAMLEFEQKISVAAAEITEDEKTRADEIIARTTGVKVETITPAMAAYILIAANSFNRNMTFSKAYDFAAAMQRGEWKVNHQGIAFYLDNRLADGQHRLAGIAISGVAQTLLVFSGFDSDAIDTIDRSIRRTAGEALEMFGVEKGKVKAAAAKAALEIISEIDSNVKVRLTDQQIEGEVHGFGPMYKDMLDLAEKSTQNVSDPAMTIADALLASVLMVKGGWSQMQIRGFLASVQQGIATYPDSPTLALARLLLKARVAERSKDKLSKRERMALILKAAALHEGGKSVARLIWNPAKERMPDYRVPEAHPAAAE